MNLLFANIGLYSMIAGMIIIVLFTGRDSKSIAGRLASGAYNLYGISSWVEGLCILLKVNGIRFSRWIYWSGY